MMKIDFFKPLNIIKCNSPYVKDGDKTQINPFFFSEWWEYCWWENQEKNKPIIFDFDENNYYYLTSYFDSDRQKQEINFDKIFIMNKKDFESFIDNNNKLNIDEINQNEILDNIKEKIMINPPEFSLIKIKKDKQINSCKSETLYWSEKLFLNFIDYLESDESIIDLDEKKFH